MSRMPSARQPAQAAPRRPGRPRGSVNASTEATRERILEVATELFSAAGFHATSVADIGARSDLQQGALYYHIKSKEEVLWEILRRYTEKALASASSVAAADRDPVDKLGELIDVHVDIITRHRREVAIQMRDADALSAEHATQLQALRQGVQDCWDRVLEEGYRMGKLTRANRVISSGLLGMVNSVSFWFRPDRGDTAAKVADEFRTMVIDGLVQ
jgi:AcrR family transcriptional regulator